MLITNYEEYLKFTKFQHVAIKIKNEQNVLYINVMSNKVTKNMKKINNVK